MWLVLFHLAGAGLHSLLLFFTFQTFSWRDIISITHKVDAITVVCDTTEELLQVLYLQYMEGPAPKMMMMKNECHGIYYHYNTVVGWWQAVHFHP